MSLTADDRKWIREVLAGSEERVYRRIKDNALSEITKRFDGHEHILTSLAGDVAKITTRLDGHEHILTSLAGDVAKITTRLDGHEEILTSMAEEVAKISVIEEEIRYINVNIESLRLHAGI